MSIRIEQNPVAGSLSQRLASIQERRAEVAQRLSTSSATAASMQQLSTTSRIDELRSTATAQTNTDFAAQVQKYNEAMTNTPRVLEASGAVVTDLGEAKHALLEMRRIATGASETGGDDGDAEVMGMYLGELARIAGSANPTQAAAFGVSLPSAITDFAARVNPANLGKGATGLETSARNVSEIDVSTAAGARDAVKLIDAALTEVSQQETAIGAFQKETMSAYTAWAEKQATNRPLGQGSLELASLSIAQNPALAMLSQANTLPQQVYMLLQ